MSRELIEAWLDGEIDQDGQAKLEVWLQADPAHRREFLQAASLQEELRAAYQQRQPVELAEPVSPWREAWAVLRQFWVPVAGVAAALLVVILIDVFPQRPTPPPEDPTGQWQANPVDPSDPPVLLAANQPVHRVSGELQIEPVGGQEPVATAASAVVQSGKAPGRLRWGQHLELELAAHTRLVLASEPAQQAPDAQSPDRLVTLTDGRVRVKQLAQGQPGEPSATIQRLAIATPAGRLVATDAEFVVACFSAPAGRQVSVSVTRGEVKVLDGNRGDLVRVGAGQTMTLPAARP